MGLEHNCRIWRKWGSQVQFIPLTFKRHLITIKTEKHLMWMGPWLYLLRVFSPPISLSLLPLACWNFVSWFWGFPWASAPLSPWPAAAGGEEVACPLTALCADLDPFIPFFMVIALSPLLHFTFRISSCPLFPSRAREEGRWDAVPSVSFSCPLAKPSVHAGLSSSQRRHTRRAPQSRGS